jgi:hypothetical protein
MQELESKPETLGSLPVFNVNENKVFYLVSAEVYFYQDTFCLVTLSLSESNM